MKKIVTLILFILGYRLNSLGQCDLGFGDYFDRSGQHENLFEYFLLYYYIVLLYYYI